MTLIFSMSFANFRVAKNPTWINRNQTDKIETFCHLRIDKIHLPRPGAGLLGLSAGSIPPFENRAER